MNATLTRRDNLNTDTHKEGRQRGEGRKGEGHSQAIGRGLKRHQHYQYFDLELVASRTMNKHLS